ncbi:hypothetical protein CBL_09831 [Carabus blaptoides fortunei]
MAGRGGAIQKWGALIVLLVRRLASKLADLQRAVTPVADVSYAAWRFILSSCGHICIRRNPGIISLPQYYRVETLEGEEQQEDINDVRISGGIFRLTVPEGYYMMMD